MSKQRLSHSAVSRYQMCGMSYKYHYVDRIRPSITSGALLFGSAFDAAINELLVPKGNFTPEQIFYKEFTQSKINDKIVHTPSYPDIVYAYNDLDLELLTTVDWEWILSWNSSNEYLSGDVNIELLTETVESIRKTKKALGWTHVSLRDKKFYNVVNYCCMLRKGYLMIEAYRQKVVPRFEKVYETQRFVKVTNDEQDSIIGYVDVVADVKGYGTVILDNKTSSIDYEPDAVLVSPQLSLYVHLLKEEYNTRKAGYIVLKKNVIKNRTKTCPKCGHDGTGKRHKTCDATVDGKRCNGTWEETIKPEVEVQVLIDEIPEQTEKIVLDNYEEICYSLKTGTFSRNFNSCANVYGGPCPYIGLCFKGSMKGLVNLTKEPDTATKEEA